MNKKIAICSFILLAFVLIFIILYIKTDFLKTKEQLFWKYLLLEKDEIVNVLSNEEVYNYNAKLKKSSYIKEGNIFITSKNKLVNPINVKLSEKGNNEEDSKNILIELNYNNKNIDNTAIIKDGNYFLIKNDLISSNYIGFENENLKQLAEDLGMPYAKFIPNKIEEIDYFKLFSISNVEINHLLKKYIPIYRRHINNRDYIKEENVKLDGEKGNITLYKVQLSEKQLNNLIIDVLKESSKDEESLNFISKKAKILNSKTEYSNVSNIKNKINELVEYFEKKEVDDETFLTIIIYINKNNVVKTELVLKNNRTISIETDKENKIIIKQYDVEDKDINLNTIDAIIRTILNSITEITYKKNIENNDKNKVDISITFDIGIESITFNYNYIEQIKNKVENITKKDNVEYLDLKKLDR